MDAKEYLEQIRMIDAMIENKLLELEELKFKSTDISASLNTVGVQSSKNPYKMERLVDTYIDFQSEIVEQIITLQERRHAVRKVLWQLPWREGEVLEQVYVKGMSLGSIAVEKGYSYTWATNLHGKGLKKVQKILDEQGMN